MAGRQTRNPKAGFGGIYFIPVHFDNLLCRISPVFKMFPHTERTDDFVHFVAYRFHSPVIEVVVMVVRENEQIERRNVAGLIEVGSCERLEKAAQRETGVQSGDRPIFSYRR